MRWESHPARWWASCWRRSAKRRQLARLAQLRKQLSWRKSYSKMFNGYSGYKTDHVEADDSVDIADTKRIKLKRLIPLDPLPNPIRPLNVLLTLLIALRLDVQLLGAPGAIRALAIIA